MSKTNLRNSSIPQSYKANVEAKAPQFTNKLDGETYSVQVGLVPNPRSHFSSSTDVIPCIFKTIASCLAAPFFKCKADTALVFQKESGEIIAAAISKYNAESGYNFVVSFDPVDVQSIAKEKIVNYTDFVDENRNMNFFEIFISEMLISHNYGITDNSVISTFVMSGFETLFHWLDVNASTDEVVELDITDWIGVYEDVTEEEYNSKLKTVATASVEVVKDVKKMSVVFGEETKAIAKGNADINS